jgi:hypothetical protein
MQQSEARDEGQNSTGENMRKAIAVLALALLTVADAKATPHHREPQYQTLTGVATTTDAERHYLISAAHFAAPNATDPVSVNAVAFKAWFMNAIAAFNETQSTLTDATAETNAMTAFLSERDSQVAYYIGQITAKYTPRQKADFYAKIEKARQKLKSKVAVNQIPTKLETRDIPGGGQSEQLNCADGSTFPTCSATISATINTYAFVGKGQTDSFQRANGSIGSNWDVGSGSFTITSDLVAPAATGQSFGYFTPYYPSADAQTSITLGSSVQSGGGFGACVRMGIVGNNNRYCTYFNNSSGTYQVLQYKWLSGVATLLGSWTAPAAFAVGDTLTIEAQQNLISVYYNGMGVIDTFDSSISAGYTGIDAPWGGTTSISSFSGNSSGITFQIYPVMDGQGTMVNVPHGTVTHTPGVTLTQNGGTPSQINGTGVCPTCYFYADGDFYPILGTDDTGTLSINIDGILVCSVVGQFFDGGGTPGLWELATTYVNNADVGHQHGNTYSKGPDGNYYQWYWPSAPFSGGANTPTGSWQNFAGPVPYYGYDYELTNACSAATTPPDADMSQFTITYPEVLVSGNTTWNGFWVIPQGNSFLLKTPLWRATNNSQWITNAPITFLVEDLISPDKNFAWNLPAAQLHPIMNGLTVSNQTCTYTSTPSTNVSIKVQEADYCIGHLPIYGNGTVNNCNDF